MINAIGDLGGAVGPTSWDGMRESTGTYTGGLLVLVGALVIEAILVMSLRLPTRAAARPTNEIELAPGRGGGAQRIR